MYREGVPDDAFTVLMVCKKYATNAGTLTNYSVGGDSP